MYAYIGATWRASPSQLGTLTLCRALVQALSSPVGGFLGAPTDAPSCTACVSLLCSVHVFYCKQVTKCMITCIMAHMLFHACFTELVSASCGCRLLLRQDQRDGCGLPPVGVLYCSVWLRQHAPPWHGSLGCQWPGSCNGESASMRDAHFICQAESQIEHQQAALPAVQVIPSGDSRFHCTPLCTIPLTSCRIHHSRSHTPSSRTWSYMKLRRHLAP